MLRCDMISGHMRDGDTEMMDELDLTLLISLEETGSLSNTAAELYLTQPAISKRLNNLEQRFGAPLAVRSRNGLLLTPAGEYLCREAKIMQGYMEKVEHNINRLKHEVCGTLKIGATATVTKYILPTILQKFHEKYPAVDFRVTTSWSYEIMEKLRQHALHIGIVRGDFAGYDGYDGYESMELMKEKVYIVSKEKFKLSDLPRMPQISYSRDIYMQKMIGEWWRRNFGDRLVQGMDLSNVEAAKGMVAAGLGYIFVTERLIPDTWKAYYKLAMTDTEGNPIMRKTSLVVPRICLDMETVKQFKLFVEELYDEKNVNNGFYNE